MGQAHRQARGRQLNARIADCVATALLALLAGCAAQADIATKPPIGQVVGVYVERYAGVYVDRSVAPDAAGRSIWVRIAFDKPLTNGRSSVMAQADANVQSGDLVRVSTSEDGWHVLDDMPNEARVTAIVAKRDSEKALSFAKRFPARGKTGGVGIPIL